MLIPVLRARSEVSPADLEYFARLSHNPQLEEEVERWLAGRGRAAKKGECLFFRQD